MELVYFNQSGANLTKYVDHPEGGIVCEALLFYEGEHPDNKKQKHLCPPERIHKFAANTNVDYNKGRDIPVMVEHQRKLIDQNGSVNKLGKMASAVSCRPIEEQDLANPRLSHLVGKLGAFAQLHIQDKIDAVKSKTIKALSAGIDPIANKFVEISAVADPALPGASLLFSSPYGDLAAFSTHGMTDYSEAKEKIEAWEKPHQELHKKFDIFVGTIMAIAQSDMNEQQYQFNSKQLKRNALEQFTEDLMDYLDISFDEEGEEEDIYNSNPYQENLYNQQNQSAFSAEDQGAEVLEFSDIKREKRKKRRKRGA